MSRMRGCWMCAEAMNSRSLCLSFVSMSTQKERGTYGKADGYVW